ncbi:MAG: tetratricopeptide repeat protein [Chloroflexota bacterium]
MTQLQLKLLGSPLIERHNVQAQMSTRKTTALLIYLAMTQQAHHRELLMRLFWPESDSKRGRASLRRALADIKKSIGDGWLIVEQDRIGLNLTANVSVDVWQFQQFIQSQERKKSIEAIELYRADFLDGFGLRDAPEFDEWQFFERETLRQQFAQGLDALIQWHIDEGAFEQAVPYSRKRVTLDPLHEPAHFQLMYLYSESGQRTAALRQYEQCQQLYESELGIKPSPATRELYKQIKANRTQTPAPTLSRLQQKSHNLPTLSTSFVGRETELDQIIGTFDKPEVRLLTLFGLGGVGKTRLALQVAQTYINTFKDGVWFIDLVAVRSSYSFISTIADTLNLSLRGVDSLQEQLQATISNKEMLLLFDNFEHLASNALKISALLQHAPQLKIIVTSRVVLNLAEEWLYEVGGLAYPATTSIPEWADSVLPNNYGRYNAVQLFTQRARQLQHNFYLPLQQTDVIQICQHVEGLPLALELAAALIRQMNCAQIAEAIKENLDFLTSLHVNTTERHRSIRAVFEYSWQMLSSAEQTALAKLSVFRGSFSYDAALAIVDVPRFTLYGLINKSLLRISRSGRYDTHELLRQFAAEKLNSPESVQEQHMQYYTTLLAENENALFGGEQTLTLALIHEEIENVYEAWLWAAQNGRFAILNNAFHSLYNYHAMRGLYYQGEQLLQRTIPLLEPYLAISKQEATALTVRLMARQGEYLYMLSKLSQAEDRLLQALSLAKQMHMTDQIMLTSQTLGVVLYIQGNYAEAQKLLNEALNMATKHNNRHRQAYTRATLGAIEQALGNFERAQEQHEASLAIYKSLDYQWGVAQSLRLLGVTAFHVEKYEEATVYLQKSLTIARTMDNDATVAIILNNLGMVNQAKNNLSEAHQNFLKSLALGESSHIYLTQATVLQNLGRIMKILKQPHKGKKYARQALDLAAKIEAVPLVLDILLDIVPRLGAEHQQTQAHIITNYVEKHPASRWETQERAKQLRAQLTPLPNIPMLKVPDTISLNQVVSNVMETY